MMTVVDQVSPWFTPSSTLANTIQLQLGAQINSNGTGRPMIQPATRTGLRPTRSDSVPAKKLVIALTTPNATMNVSVAVNAVRPNTRSASSGSTVRSWPIIPPTSALTPTSSENCARFSRRPSRIGLRVSRHSIVSSGAAGRVRPVVGTAREHATGRAHRWPRGSQAAVIARSPCPHITVTGPSGTTSSRDRGCRARCSPRRARGRRRTRCVGGRR